VDIVLDFEPGISFPHRQANRALRAHPVRWHEIPPPGEAAEPPAQGTVEESKPPPSLLFDEDELARICARLAVRLRAQEEARRAAEREQEESHALARFWQGLEEYLLEERRRRAEARARLGELLDLALRHLAQGLAARFERAALEATLEEWRGRLFPDERVIVRVRPEMRERLAAAWSERLQQRQATRFEIEFVADATLAPGALRLERDNGGIFERDPQCWAEELAAALAACLRGEEGAAASRSGRKTAEREPRSAEECES